MCLLLTAQEYVKPVVRLFPEQDETTKIYTVESYRHGVSFFPKVMLPHVEYKAGDKLSFDKFHTTDVIYTWMVRFSEQYPDLVDIYEIGKSFVNFRNFAFCKNLIVAPCG